MQIVMDKLSTHQVASVRVLFGRSVRSVLGEFLALVGVHFQAIWQNYPAL